MRGPFFLAAVFVYEVRHPAELEKAGSNPDAALTRGPFLARQFNGKTPPPSNIKNDLPEIAIWQFRCVMNSDTDMKSGGDVGSSPTPAASIFENGQGYGV